MSTDVVFSEATPFFMHLSEVEEDEWLIYQGTRYVTKQSDDVVLPSSSSFIENQSTSMPSKPSSSVPTRLPIIQVYSRRRGNDDTYPTSTPLSLVPSPLDSSENLDLPIALRKGTHQCKSTYSITLFLMITYLLHLAV